MRFLGLPESGRRRAPDAVRQPWRGVVRRGDGLTRWRPSKPSFITKSQQFEATMDDMSMRIRCDCDRLRDQAAAFRRLAAEHQRAGNLPIARKLSEVATEFEIRVCEPETNSSTQR
jgi:hypothetical protein